MKEVSAYKDTVHEFNFAIDGIYPDDAADLLHHVADWVKANQVRIREIALYTDGDQDSTFVVLYVDVQ